MTKTIDALIARDRLLAELSNVVDVEEGQALWRAAGRYNAKWKAEQAVTLESGDSPPLAHAWGGTGGSDPF